MYNSTKELLCPHSCFTKIKHSVRCDACNLCLFITDRLVEREKFISVVTAVPAMINIKLTVLSHSPHAIYSRNSSVLETLTLKK